MTQSVVAEAGTAPATPRPEGKSQSYRRLGKLDVFDYYLSAPVVLAAILLPLSGLSGRGVGTLALLLLGQVLVIMAMVALDDVTGYRDGSDLANYGPDHPLRNKLRKPLVAGTLTEREALRFAWICAVAGAAVWALTVAVAPHRPLWAVVLLALLYVVSLQYSYGLKISYHGFQEAFLVALGLVLVLAPYGLLTGQYTGFLLVQGLLFGFGPLMFGVYSNTNDVEGDRAVGRPTVAALVSPRGNAVFVGALSAAEYLISVMASVTGLAPWWFALVMLPAGCLRLRQYVTGFRAGNVMVARRTGFLVHRLSVVLLVVANLLVGAGAS
ncbi:UbiA family prenyltransferase [Streptomyces sp. NBC_01754]|uniref:UbiA family prenyltransferase n=1 Tax=Streptomyces sp. NBC_01754 TaxID=2975930 RepID=UPI002DD7A34A|nr:UbiA family prenyltransferase [Streptomyces sp. NBC_01754]WSC94905.1 UbiA family prenyltransferase [Streptomyces sp. NBC_01754]